MGRFKWFAILFSHDTFDTSLDINFPLCLGHNLTFLCSENALSSTGKSYLIYDKDMP